jgi:hypothetical protein
VATIDVGQDKSKRVFIGRIIGKAALKNVLKDEERLRKNTQTTLEVMAKEKSGDLEIQRKKWIDEIEEYATFLTMNLCIRSLEK